MSFQVPDYIRTLVPYVPGKPIEETQREFRIKKVIKLASNENPLGASPKAKRAIASTLGELNRYPDGSGFRLKQALKKMFPSSPSVILGNGSNDVIDHLIRTFCLAGDAIATSQAAFIAYKICAQIHGVKTLETPLNKELKFDVKELADLARKNDRVRLVFVANPNNPTGTYVTRSELKTLVRELSSIRDGSVILVLDYAYWEYVTAKDLPNPLEILQEYPNTVILRTFSKVYGLAGLRVGYGMGSSELISHMEKVRQPFNINSSALVGAEAALNDKSFVARAKLLNEKGMSFWEKHLNKLGVPFWKSQGNFIMIDCKQGFGMSGVDLNNACLPLGLILRPVANYGLPDLLRITVGTPEENKKAGQVLKQIQSQTYKSLGH
ncbi:MAG: histidinol-phosphate transaminase [Bdellovibrionia bacterium]